MPSLRMCVCVCVCACVCAWGRAVVVQIFGPQGEALYSVQRQRQGEWNMRATTTGSFRICFSNRMSTITEKQVVFNVHTGDAVTQGLAKKGASRRALCPPATREAAV
ncbi:emp24/gp25L/p24 family protein [archaeon]|nr:MAG: emp24/gp25L/p24 family protein [archaeon]